MGCSLEDCSFYRACDLAESIIGAPHSPVPREVLQMKLNELGLTKELFKRVSVECNGQTDEGRCGQGSLVGDTRNFMFGSTSVPLTSQSPDERPAFGFGG